MNTNKWVNLLLRHKLEQTEESEWNTLDVSNKANMNKRKYKGKKKDIVILFSSPLDSLFLSYAMLF